MADVPIYNPATNLVENHDEKTASELIRAGMGEVASPERIQQDALERKYAGGLGNQALALGAAVARGATAGLSDVALTELGGNDYREALSAYRELHPTTSTFGELAGALAMPIPGGGEAGLLATVAREATVGGIIGGGAALSEQALSGKGYSGEALAAGVGLGAILGGGIGGAFSGAGRLVRGGSETLKSAVRRPGVEAIEALVEHQTGEAAARGVGEAGSSILAKAYKLAGVDGATELAELTGLRKASVEARHVAANAEQIIERASKTFVQEAEKTESTLQLLREKAGIGKKEQWAAKVAVERPAETLQAARELAAQHLGRFNEMVEAGEGTYGNVNKLNTLRKKAAATLEKLKNTADPAEAAYAYDLLKRDIGSIAKKVSKGRLSNQQATASALKEIYHESQGFLENAAIWGEDAAAMQRSVNHEWETVIDQARTDPRVQRFLTFQEGKFTDPGKYILDPVKANKLLRNAGDEANAEAIAGWKTRLGNQQNLAQAALENSSLSAAERRQLETFSASSSKQIQALTDIEEAALRRKQLNGLGGGAFVGNMALGAIGGAIGSDGELGGAGAMAVAAGFLGNPRRAIRMLAGLETAVGRGVRSVEKTGQEVVAKKGASILPRVVTASALEVFDRKKAIQNIETIRNTTPAQIATQVRQNMGAFAMYAPALLDDAVKTAQRAATYLSVHAPQPSARPGVIMAMNLPPSDYEIEIFERRRKAVAKPLSVVDDIKSGIITPEAVHAIKNVYPEVYMRIKQSLMVELGELAGRGESLPLKKIMSLETFLGQPVEGINAPEVIDAIQQSYKKDTEPKPGKPARPAPDVAKYFQNETDSAMREVG